MAVCFSTSEQHLVAADEGKLLSALIADLVTPLLGSLQVFGVTFCERLDEGVGCAVSVKSLC
jgi:hypothetical protein